MQNNKQTIAISKRSKERSISESVFAAENNHQTKQNNSNIRFDEDNTYYMLNIAKLKEEQEKIKSAHDLSVKRKQD
jgi:hypothetical protein